MDNSTRLEARSKCHCTLHQWLKLHYLRYDRSKSLLFDTYLHFSLFASCFRHFTTNFFSTRGPNQGKLVTPSVTELFANCNWMRLYLQTVKSCAILGTSTSPCSSLTSLPFSFRMSWDRPASVGYDTYFPNNAYGIDYYRVEVSVNPSDFRNLVVSVTCQIGQ
jgi:hypothetical protein